MTPHEFVAKWKPVTLKEMSAYSEHFLDLCAVLGEKTPAEVDPTGTWFTFQKGLTKTDGTKGWADVWRRGFFGWEYKGKHKDLKAAYQQLLKYREALNNPPLLIVCDLDQFEIHTNFPNTAKQVTAFDLDGLTDPKNLAALKHAFTDPDKLKPGTTQAHVTAEIAVRFAKLSDGMRDRDVEPHDAAHFLMKLMFCMFAEDIDLLPSRLFARTVIGARADPTRLTKLLGNLFESMAKGEPFGADDIEWFNGGLFSDANVVELTKAEIAELLACAECDWSQVEASIFGTLFERCLDPDKRSQFGTHYTGRPDVETLLKPVLLDMLRREWDAVRTHAESLWDEARTAEKKSDRTRARKGWERCINDFHHRLSTVEILDPACGSGNFLYVALHMLLDLEKELLTYAASRDQQTRIRQVLPKQLHGIEKNVYAQQLAQVVIWIGYLQWGKFNGFTANTHPVLDSMDNIQCADAILDLTDPANLKEPDWPDAEFIVGNPPFLGGKLLRRGLGDDYVNALFRVYNGRVRRNADLCCYWFEKARAIIGNGGKRAGLLATQGIRGKDNRFSLDRIVEQGQIFFAVSDQL